MKVVLEPKMGVAQLANIDNLADDGELSELEALEVIDLFEVGVGGRVLKNWVGKLAHGGTITLSSTDLIHLSKMLNLRLLDVGRANEVLFGIDGSRKAAYSNQTLKDALEACGLKVMKNRTAECKVVVVARRP